MRVCVAVVAALGLLAASAAAQPLTLELVPETRPIDTTIPPMGSHWHEIHPNYCTDYEQTGYDDADGDGHLSYCDNITLYDPIGGTTYVLHIVWAGPTYWLTWVGGAEPPWTNGATEPTDPDDWHWVYPPEAYCTYQPINDWEDSNFNGEMDFCDNILIGDSWWHIEEVGVNIEVQPGSPVEQSSWSKIKAFFGDLF